MVRPTAVERRMRGGLRAFLARTPRRAPRVMSRNVQAAKTCSSASAMSERREPSAIRLTYYVRRKKGVRCVSLEVNGQIIDFLARARWLHEGDAHDASKIAEAIRQCLQLSAKL